VFHGGGVFTLFASRLGWFAISASRYTLADLQRDVVVERAGMRLLIGDAQYWQYIQNDARLDFEFSSQLVDANFTHT
jgi:hypothetical protein